MIEKGSKKVSYRSYLKPDTHMNSIKKIQNFDRQRVLRFLESEKSPQKLKYNMIFQPFLPRWQRQKIKKYPGIGVSPSYRSQSAVPKLPQLKLKRRSKSSRKQYLESVDYQSGVSTDIQQVNETIQCYTIDGSKIENCIEQDLSADILSSNLQPIFTKVDQELEPIKERYDHLPKLLQDRVSNRKRMPDADEDLRVRHKFRTFLRAESKENSINMMRLNRFYNKNQRDIRRVQKIFQGQPCAPFRIYSRIPNKNISKLPRKQRANQCSLLTGKSGIKFKLASN